MPLPKLLRQLTHRTLKNLRTLPELLAATPIRAMTYPATQTQYFSAVDICHWLCNPMGTVMTRQSLRRAKSYWQYIKRSDPYFDLLGGYVGLQLSLPDCHGRFRQTDVIDTETVLYLIKKITHQHSRVVKLWLLLVGVRQVVRAVLGWVMGWIKRVIRLVRACGRALRLGFVRAQAFDICPTPPWS